MSRSSSEMLEAISTTLAEDGGAFALTYSTQREADGPWLAAIEWGREDEESDMAGAAAYGMGSSAAQAIEMMLMEANR